jgi:hypothetical protein
MVHRDHVRSKRWERGTSLLRRIRQDWRGVLWRMNRSSAEDVWGPKGTACAKGGQFPSGVRLPGKSAMLKSVCCLLERHALTRLLHVSVLQDSCTGDSEPVTVLSQSQESKKGHSLRGTEKLPRPVQAQCAAPPGEQAVLMAFSSTIVSTRRIRKRRKASAGGSCL